MKTCQVIQFPFIENAEGPTPWELWLHNGINAEASATICGQNPWETTDDLLALKASETPVRKPETEAMVQGRLKRPVALEAYRNAVGIPGMHGANFQNKERPWMIAHPDLFDFKTLHIAEVHCGAAALDKAIRTGRLPRPYWAEAQHTLAVAGLKFLHVYLHGTPTTPSKTFKVWANLKYQTDMIQAETAFYQKMQAERARAAKAAQAAAESVKVTTVTTITTALPSLIKAVQLAIAKQGPRVDKPTYKLVVPTYVNRNGKLTGAGEKLAA
jgi:predicted phage-related endonuclease